MKIMQVLVFLAALNFIVLGCSEAKTENPWDTKLPFETAVIEYSLSGTQTGAETLYIKDFGKNRAKHTNAVTKMLFMKVESNTVEVVTPDTFVNVDLKEKTGVSMPNPAKQNREAFEQLTAGEKKQVAKNIELLAQKGMDLFAPGGTAEKKEAEFLGHKVDVMNVGGMVIWVLKGTDIPVKSSISVMGMKTEIVATKIDLGASVKDEVFAVPAGINIQANPYADQMAGQMAGPMVDMEALKDPKFEEKIDAYIAEMKKQADSGMQMGGGMPPKAMPA